MVTVVPAAVSAAAVVVVAAVVAGAMQVRADGDGGGNRGDVSAIANLSGGGIRFDL